MLSAPLFVCAGRSSLTCFLHLGNAYRLQLIASAWPDARIYLPLAATPVVVELPELAAPELAAPPPVAAAVVLLAPSAAAAPAAAELAGTGTGASVTTGSATNQGRTDFWATGSSTFCTNAPNTGVSAYTP